MARDDWIACIVPPAREYFVKTELERLDLHPYLPQFFQPWRLSSRARMQRKLSPLFGRVLLLPEREARSPAVRDISSIEVSSLRIPPPVISQLLLREAEGTFDRERPKRSAQHARQVRIDRKVALRLPRAVAAVPREPDVVERFVERLVAVAARNATAAAHVGAR